MIPEIILSASIGYGVESIFGFGGSVVTYLLLTLFLPVKEAISLLPIFAVAGSLFILISDWRAVKWGVIRRVSLFALPALAAGVLAMNRVPETALAVGVLLFILIYGIMQSFGRNPLFPGWMHIPMYLVSGFVIGAVSLGVLFVPVLTGELGDRRSFRASLALLWFITACLRLPLYMLTGHLDTSGLLSGIWSFPFLLLAIFIGFKVHRMIPESSYKRLVGIAIALVSLAKLLLML